MQNIYRLKNDYQTATFNTLGAEITSLVFNETGREYLWQGKSVIWERQNPVLFPIIASLENDSYREEENIYMMKIHGFAKDQHFKVVSFKEEEIHFELTESTETLQFYPFHFLLEVVYKIFHRAVEIEYKITNPDIKPLKCFIGGHPTFVCPLYENTNFSDYYLLFERKENLDRQLMDGPCLSNAYLPLLRNQDRLHLEKSLFKENAIVTQNIHSKWIEYRSEKHQHGVRLTFGDFPFLGIYSNPEPSTDAYICIEPWHGLPARWGLEKELSDKPGLISLFQDQIFSIKYKIEIF